MAEQFIAKQDNNPKRLKSFYKEFCHVIKKCKTRVADVDQEEIDLVKVLFKLHYICNEGCQHSNPQNDSE